MVQSTEVMSRERLDRYIEEAARAAGYEEGFGVRDCDLNEPIWWAAYARQSNDEQVKNNRLPDYLLTMARIAKLHGLVVPREYVLYDHKTGEHLERPSMLLLRRDLVHKRRIKGIIFADLRCLSREPAPQQVFERECEILGVKLLFGDAPSGMDIGSQFARSAITFSNKLGRVGTHRNARGGNIGRVLKGWVPASRAAYGYRYCRDAEIAADGKVIIKKAWWEVNELGPDDQPLWKSPAWAVVQIFTWVGAEGRTLYWIAKSLNEMGIKAPEGGNWSPARVANIVHHHCYTGNHAYNANARVPNPNRPLGDITAEVKRTLVRPKPEEEWVNFKVPALIGKQLWQKANAYVAERGRGRGKQGKRIQALLRNRIFCPRCGKSMVVRRDGRQNRIYYHCSKYFRPWAENPCSYTRFVTGTWDDIVWGDICTWLRDDTWVEQQLAQPLHNEGEPAERLIRLEEWKIKQAEVRIARIQEAYESSEPGKPGAYTKEEAANRIGKHREAIARAEREIKSLMSQPEARSFSRWDVETMREELKILRDRNLDEATFDDKLEVISKLGIKVHPSEDLKSMRVVCQLNLEQVQSDNQGGRTEFPKSQADGECESAIECGKVLFGSPSRIRTVS